MIEMREPLYSNTSRIFRAAYRNVIKNMRLFASVSTVITITAVIYTYTSLSLASLQVCNLNRSADAEMICNRLSTSIARAPPSFIMGLWMRNAVVRWDPA